MHGRAVSAQAQCAADAYFLGRAPSPDGKVRAPAADGMYRVHEGRIVQARVIAVAEKVIRVEVFGVECSILARDLAWDWIGDAHERFAVGDEVLVRIPVCGVRARKT